MAKHGKNYRAAKDKVEERSYELAEALNLAKELSSVKFDETVEIALRLGVDPKHADQMVRGNVVLPHGTGSEVRVLVFAGGDQVKEAEEAGADIVGGEELAKKIQGGWTDFDAVVATPDMMRVVGRLGRVLGPRGLMPNPKSGTVTMDVTKAVQDIKAGKVDFRVDKAGIIQGPLGKVSFSQEQLLDNGQAFISTVIKAKPAASKGKYLKTVSVSSTMGPGIRLDESSLAATEA